jgi:SAM-dependent methyltransferase
MTDWQERIDRETPPAIRAEHELRYRTAAPLIRTSGTWLDLGCGNGTAPSRVLGDDLPEHVVLIDVDTDAVAAAAGELGRPDAVTLTGDIVEPDTLALTRDAILSGRAPRVATCFEVVEHLTSFVDLVGWATELASEHDTTIVMSVPNDALWSIENPFHLARWGEGAFAELRRLLPKPHTALRQVTLSGSALVADGSEDQALELSVRVDGSLPASHFVVAFGPRHGELASGAVAEAHDQREQRRWERQRESNLAHAEATVEHQNEDLARLLAEREDWRAYIHELERQLGRPLSGSDVMATP